MLVVGLRGAAGKDKELWRYYTHLSAEELFIKVDSSQLGSGGLH
jgi:hypothetical protein